MLDALQIEPAHSDLLFPALYQVALWPAVLDGDKKGCMTFHSWSFTYLASLPGYVTQCCSSTPREHIVKNQYNRPALANDSN